MKLLNFSGHFMAALIMMVLASLSLSAEAVFLKGDGAFTVGKGEKTLIIQKFAKANLEGKLKVWKRVAIAADVIKDRKTLSNTHFFALVDPKTDNLIILRESKSLIGHNILVAVKFKHDTIPPNIIQNKRNMNVIAIKKNYSSMVGVHYLSTNTKKLKPMNFENARIAIVKGEDENAQILFASNVNTKETKWIELVAVSLTHDNIIKAQTYKLKANADNKVKLNLQNKFGTPTMIKANAVTNEVENNGTTAQILNNLNPYTPNGQIFAKTNKIIKKEFSAPQILMSADAKRLLNFDATDKEAMLHANATRFFSLDPADNGKKFGEHMLHAYATKISLDPIKNNKSSEFYGQPLLHAYATKISLDPNNYSKTGQGVINNNLKMELQTTGVHANNVSFAQMSFIA